MHITIPKSGLYQPALTGYWHFMCKTNTKPPSPRRWPPYNLFLSLLLHTRLSISAWLFDLIARNLKDTTMLCPCTSLKLKRTPCPAWPELPLVSPSKWNLTRPSRWGQKVWLQASFLNLCPLIEFISIIIETLFFKVGGGGLYLGVLQELPLGAAKFIKDLYHSFESHANQLGEHIPGIKPSWIA